MQFLHPGHALLVEADTPVVSRLKLSLNRHGPVLQTDFSKFNFTKYLRGIALLSQGVEPVELNEAFLEQLEATCAGRGAILYDEVRSRIRFRKGLGLKLGSDKNYTRITLRSRFWFTVKELIQGVRDWEAIRGRV